MKKFSSKNGSELIKTAKGYRFKVSKKEWHRLGKEAGWFKKAQYPLTPEELEGVKDMSKDIEIMQFMAGEKDRLSRSDLDVNIPDSYTDEDAGDLSMALNHFKSKVGESLGMPNIPYGEVQKLKSIVENILESKGSINREEFSEIVNRELQPDASGHIYRNNPEDRDLY